MKVQSQVMYYYTPSYKNVLKSNLTPKNNRSFYVVKAYDINGNKTKPFIDTNIKSVSCDNLDKYEYHDFKKYYKFNILSSIFYGAIDIFTYTILNL